MREMPQVVGSSYTTTTAALSDWHDLTATAASAYRRLNLDSNQSPIFTISQKQEQNVANPKRRLVQVFIADPDVNVPLAESLLYTGEQKLTDATDQELFFEVDIKNILEAHNEKRVKLPNKTVKERVELLEPARIRDLKMVVVTIAEF